MLLAFQRKTWNNWNNWGSCGRCVWFSSLCECVIQNHVVFCPSGRAPSERCLNSAWLRPAKRLPSRSHQLPAQAALTDSTFFFFFFLFSFLYSFCWPSRRTMHTGRETDWQAFRQEDMGRVQIYNFPDAHTITPVNTFYTKCVLFYFSMTLAFDYECFF